MKETMITGKTNMTRADVISEIAGRTGISKTVVRTVTEEFMQVIKESILGGMSVQLRGFGSFFRKKKSSKKARNISKGITMTIPAHEAPAFKPSKDFNNSLKEK
jgi:DNA-binding protein HU-beta